MIGINQCRIVTVAEAESILLFESTRKWPVAEEGDPGASVKGSQRAVTRPGGVDYLNNSVFWWVNKIPPCIPERSIISYPNVRLLE